MIIHSFTNDYSEGCHPAILEALTRSNMEQQAGYGDDEYSKRAEQHLRNLTEKPDADIYLVSGGTIANLLVLSSILKPFESVIAADTGHINTHEAGAIEATGHKVEIVSSPDGKLCPDDIQPLLEKFPEYHTVRPRVVYISNSTEIGTIYTKMELIELSEFCRTNDLYLFMDGARLASALTASSNELTLKDIACLTDVFYLGGTKSGALFGEAIVITNDNLKKDFKYHQKQRGAMLAKGRTLGIQFDTLLKDGLIFDLSRYANNMAAKITKALKKMDHHNFLTDSDTNQIFPVLPLRTIEELEKRYDFYIWEHINSEEAAIRMVTSWATPEVKVDAFIADLERWL